MYEKNQCVPCEEKRAEDQASTLLTEELCHLDELCMQASGILCKLKGPKPESCEKQASPDCLLSNIKMIRERTCELSRKLNEIDKTL